MDEKILKPYKKYFVMIVILFGLSLTISLNVNCVSASQAGIYVTPNGHDSWNGQSPTWNGKSGPKKPLKMPLVQFQTEELCLLLVEPTTNMAL